jgi:hypothetical protein
LVVRYKSRQRAKVIVSYFLQGAAGNLSLGKASAQFQKHGLYRRTKHLTAAQMVKVRGATHLLVKMRIKGEPALCARAYTRHLAIKHVVHKQTVWFQKDSEFIGRHSHRHPHQAHQALCANCA